MALKQVMLRHKIDLKKTELETLRAKDGSFAAREAELETAITEAKTEEEQNAVSGQVETFETERAAHEEARGNLEQEIEELEQELSEAEQEPPAKPENRGIRRREERMNNSMMKHEIRNLPMNLRAFDALPMEQRQAIVEREDVKAFLTRLREFKGGKRAITGGELEIPTVLLELIAQNMYRYSKLLNRVRVRSIRGEARQTIAGTVPEAIWTEMCGAINELSFTFNQITLDGYKVAGFIPVCNSLLEDTVSNLDLTAWIVELISESIGLAKDKAILYGKGAAAHMPTGIVTRLAQKSKPEGYPANAPAWVDLSETNIIKIDGDSMTPVEFFSAFALAAGNAYTRYARGRKFWAMNSRTYAKIQSKLITFTADGSLVSRMAGAMPITDGDIDVLEFIPDGDVIGGYGDLYPWIERGAMQLDLSAEVQFIQDNTVFRGKERADGAPAIPGAFVALNINNQEVTTVVDFAADTANDADLRGLVLGGNTLNPTFDPKTVSYTVAAAVADTVTVEATTQQPEATVAVSYNGANIRNGGKAALLKDGTPHPLSVTVKNGNAVKVYTVNITRASG